MCVAKGHFGHFLHLVVGGLIISLLHSALASLANAETISGETMGTIRYNVTIVSLPDDQKEKIHSGIDAVLHDINQRMSTYDPSSELSRFNASQETDWFPVSIDLATVVARSIELNQATKGAFDVTVGPLVNLWSFGPDENEAEVPSQKSIDALLSSVGSEFLFARLDDPAIRKDVASLQIDLSAIAKGFAVDKVAEFIDQAGFENYLVEIGCEIRVRGKNELGHDWKLGIEKPLPGIRSIHTTALLSDGSLATSGDYRNFFEFAGQFFSHTIDPRTGRPVQGGAASVSVVADDCMTADALATALMVLPPEQGLQIAKSLGVETLILTRKGDVLVESKSSQFPQPMIQEAEKSTSFWRFFIAAFAVFAISLIGMAIGVIFSNRPVKGSCGGMGTLRKMVGLPECSCEEPPPECKSLIESRKKKLLEDSDS